MARMTTYKPPMKKEKQCKFPGCENKFMGIGAAKYCEEHRKPMYRKIINMIRAKDNHRELTEIEKGEKSNQIIKHDNTISTKETRVCPCGKEFEIDIYPGIDIYPKFCEEHRNPYRREKLLDELAKQKIDDEDITE